MVDACEDVPVGGCTSWMRDRRTGWRLRLCRISGDVCGGGGAVLALAVVDAAAGVAAVAAAPPAAVVAMVACRKMRRLSQRGDSPIGKIAGIFLKTGTRRVLQFGVSWRPCNHPKRRKKRNGVIGWWLFYL